MDFEAVFKKYQDLTEEGIERYLPPDTTYPPIIHQAMNYSLKAPGKRLRPVLLLAAGEWSGETWEKLLPAAVGVECLHTYSLIHDDLPAMDNDDFRRGKPTNHKIFGEAVAILAGDALLTKAFELTAMAFNLGVPAERVLRAVNELAKASGSQGLIAGQVVDLTSDEKNRDSEILHYIHLNKTGRLIRYSLMAGGILAGAPEEDIVALDTYGRHLGLAFQIVDDLLDVIGDFTKIGKPPGSDEKNQKLTYVSLYGVEETRQRAQQEIDAAKNVIKRYGEKSRFFLKLADFILKRES